MSYSTDNLKTAGKITIFTTLVGIAVFALVFIFNIGEKQVNQAIAQDSATTTVIVLNTPPAWTATTTELIESSSSTPTNAGDVVSWVAIGTDSNSENYHLLICSTATAPATTTGGNAPSCVGGTQWAVSTSTASGVQAIAATTTLASWSEVNVWYGWICDANALSSRCNPVSTQGTNATNSSPFEVNHRPSFSLFSDPVVGNPGDLVTFYSTSSDSDVSGVNDTVYLTICGAGGYATSTDTCIGTTYATSTALVPSNATATYSIVIPTQDQNYTIYPYIRDNHGFEASGGAHGVAATLTVNNVAPTVDGSTISLAQGTSTNLILTVEAGQTTGFTLSFVTTDNNSCDAAGGGPADEITGYDLSIYRSGSGNSSTTCTTGAGSYNANKCYPSGSAPTAWNLVCTASTTTCSGSTDTTMQWDCTFPLWYIADPTDGTATTTQYSTNDWRAQVRGRDNNSAIGAFAESTTPVEVTSFLAFALNTLSIPYGSLEPGQETPFLSATTTIAATGNVGLDKDVQGASMCNTYTTASPCLPNDASTIPESAQVFTATTSETYASALGYGNTLSSTTPKEIEINVPKSTATSTQATASAYWGIKVPASITFAGSYTGENTFTALVGESAQW